MLQVHHGGGGEVDLTLELKPLHDSCFYEEKNPFKNCFCVFF